MFSSTPLNNHLRTSNTIETNQAVFIEWNLNQPDNISMLGNYRYRPGSGDAKYGNPNNYTTYDSSDSGNYYTGATDSDIVVDGGYDNEDEVVPFPTKKEKMNMLYSLEECIKPNRPRSGINKILYGVSASAGTFIDNIDVHYYNQSVSTDPSRRPRYYISSKFDQFKYWTSYRTESSGSTNNEYGVSIYNSTGVYYIYDAAPFAVYKNSVPTNRLVFKMQTGIGSQDRGTFRQGNIDFSDPLYGYDKARTPKRWSIQILKGTTWKTIISFDEYSTRSDGSPIVLTDGYVEIEYGLDIPEEYENYFVYAGTISNENQLPSQAPFGYAYIIKQSTEKGTLAISKGDGEYNYYSDQNFSYSWSLSENSEAVNSKKVVTSLVDPEYYIENNEKNFREFEFIDGMRILIDTMNVSNTSFDLIEFSPRLIADVSNKVVSFSITKTLSDLGSTSIPVGSLIASTGQITIFDDDFAFNETNTFNSTSATGSIISKYIDIQAKFLFYDVIKNVDGYNYFIPIKTLYSQGFLEIDNNASTVKINLRDFYFYLESQKAPQMLLTNISLSYAITILLDNIGFNNYVFKRLLTENDLRIPYFFIGPDQNVAEVLQQLALSAQAAMFFDEYNNFVVMSKGYILPEESERSTNLTLYGQFDSTTSSLPNIIGIASKQKKVFNGGQLNYTTRYIQRSLGSISQAPYIDEYKTYVNKPVLLWEVEGKEQTQSINELNQKSGGYSLFAAPLKSNLSSTVPYVSSGVVVNNIVDLGENVYWLGNYSGYFHANGEIIRFDAIEYSVSGVGNVWINNNQEYQQYFSKLEFNGKMYPTGNVRIFSEPQYNTDGTLKSGAVKRHGRGQFGTQITTHSAGLIDDEYWTVGTYTKGCIQNAKKYLFSLKDTIVYPNNLSTGVAGKKKNISGASFDADEIAKKSIRNGIIKNFLANKTVKEDDINYKKTALTGTIQSSALVYTGPKIPEGIDKVDFVTYTYKNLTEPYKHFGTRMRIVGKIESSTSDTQTPIGSYDLYGSESVVSSDPSKTVAIRGGSGGIGINVNTDTNNGYFFEIVALTTDSVSDYSANNGEISHEIAKSPVVKVINDAVTITTATQHDFNVGEEVTIAGLVDKNRSGNVDTTVNGDFTITEISQDRKSFKYSITAPELNSVTVVSASGNGTDVVYFLTENNFKAGQIVNVSMSNGSALNISNGFINNVSEDINSKTITSVSSALGYVTYTTSGPHGLYPKQSVKISGILPEGYDWQSVKIFDTPTTNTFRIASNFSGTVTDSSGTVTGTLYKVSIANTANQTGAGGTMTYVPLNTSCENGGTATKVMDKSDTISNVFFYKVVAGQEVADVIKKQKTSNKATLTTAQAHSFNVSDQVTILGVDSSFDGTYTITEVTPNTISYVSTGSNVALTDLSILGRITGVDKTAIPQILWRGFAEILVDDGKFTGQSRFVSTDKTTVYDLNIEYVNVGQSRKFYLYLNGKQIATVVDDQALNEYKNMALFVRGSSKCMFENVYAIGDNYAEGNSAAQQEPISRSTSTGYEYNGTESIRRFALNDSIQRTYLSGIRSETYPRYSMYYEEFGTILRELAYFNIRYDRAYPALYAKIAETANRTKAYQVSGFYSGAYGAEFLIFNCMDKNINLDDTSGNYLRILGTAFTQNTTYSLTVDDYFKKISNLSDPPLNTNEYNVLTNKKFYDEIKNSRLKYGLNEFSLESAYLQTTTAAEEMMGWIIHKVLYPRKSIGINTFATQHIQLGDIVKIDYQNSDGLDIITNDSERFVVYNIEISKQNTDSTMTIYVAEI